MADTAAQVRRVAARLRDRGFHVTEVPGWERRGRGAMTTLARVEHHTAGPRSGDTPSLRVVTHGRAGLRNSLARWYVSRSGRIWLVALRTSWHAGSGRLVSNATSSGTEAEHSGDPDEPWTDESLAAQEAISQEETAEFDVGVARVFDHKEHAPNRKVDRVRIAPDRWRQRIGNPPEEDWFTMATRDDLREVVREVVQEEVGEAVWRYLVEDDVTTEDKLAETLLARVAYNTEPGER